MVLFKTRNSRKISALDRSDDERNSKVDVDYLDSEYFREAKEKAMQEVEEAKARGWEITGHGSFEHMQRMIEIYEEWEKKGYFPGGYFDCYGKGAPNFYADVLLKDKKLEIISLKEDLRSRQDWKDHCRKYGSGKSTLLDFEMFDLPWLLERKEKNLGFPDNVQNQIERGRFEVFRIQDWINKLSVEGMKLRHRLSISNMTCEELEYFIKLSEEEIHSTE